MKGGILIACAGLALTFSVRAQVMEDNPLVRYPNNPLLTKGPAGSIDALKIGPRVIIREAPDVWKMWYEAVPGGNQSRTGYATSPDGIAWTKRGFVMHPTQAWEGLADYPALGYPDGGWETSPTAMLLEGGLYKMWYHGFGPDENRRIGYATSPDGITWTKYANNPILVPGTAGAWDANSICEPRVIRVGAAYYMYYSHCTGNGDIGLAISSDGVTWTKYAGNPVMARGGGWDSFRVDWAGVYYDGVNFHMWYPGKNSSTSGFSLGYAWSSDGKTWTKSPDNPVYTPPNPTLNKGDDLGLENSPVIIRLGSTWRIYYGGFASCCPEDATLCLATVAVKAAPNKAPEVDAGTDTTIALADSARLSGVVMDDDVPVALAQVTNTWTQVGGPGQSTFGDANALGSTVRFSAPGTYSLRLTANDGALATSDTVQVSVQTVTPISVPAPAVIPPRQDAGFLPNGRKVPAIRKQSLWEVLLMREKP